MAADRAAPGGPTAPATADRLRPDELVEALAAAAEVLADHAAAIDRLEAGVDWGVDPAEDGSPPGPGTDLARTLGAACRSAGATGTRDFASTGQALAAGARDAAVGPAGRRLARLLDGATEVLRSVDRLDGNALALALEAGAERLTPADDGRHPGRLPAVAAAAADGALSASDDGLALGDVLVAAADAGLGELESGALADPGLVEKGSVDAAAAGFLLLLDALASVVTGEPLPTAPEEAPPPRPSGHLYEVRCRVRPHEGCGPEEAAHLESVWHELGEVVAFEVRGGAWRAAVHTPRPGAAVEALLRVGTPEDLDIALVEPGPDRR